MRKEKKGVRLRNELRSALNLRPRGHHASSLSIGFMSRLRSKSAYMVCH